MNMKKAFAGVLASVVAISAMATVVSAKNELTFTEAQSALTKTWDFTATKFPITWKGSSQSVATVDAYTGTLATAANGKIITFVTDKDVEDVSLTIEGQAANTTAVTSKTFYAKKGDDNKNWSLEFATTANVDAGQFNLAGFAIASDKYAISVVKLSYTIKDSKEKKADAEDEAKKIKDVEVTLNSDDASGTGLLELLIKDIATTDDVTNSKVTLKATKGEVGSQDTVHGATFTGYDTDTIKASATPATAGSTGPIIGVIAAKDRKYDLVGKKITSYKETWVGLKGFADTDAGKDAAKLDAENNAKMTDTVECNWGDMLENIQDLIGDAKGATLTFNVYSATKDNSGRGNDKFAEGDDAPLAGSGATAQDFSFAVNTVSSSKFYCANNMKDNKIVLDWDTITNGLAAGTIRDGAIRIKAGASFQIDSITLDVPAKTLADLSAGEAAEETTAALTEAAAADATTAAATNPTTGNAPIALAVIPVAIAAAAIIAKKRG